MWSKKASMAWAQGTLDPAWRGLIARAEAVRKGDTAPSGQTADAAEAETTRAFARYVADFAERAERAREILKRRLIGKRAVIGRFQTGRQGGLGGARPSASKFTPNPTGPAAGAGVVRATSAS